MPWGFAAAAVGTIAGSVISSNGAQSAADTQAQSAANAQAISQQQYQNTVAQEQPYLQSGYGAQSQLNYLMGIGVPGQVGSNQGQGLTNQSGGQPGYDPSSGYTIGANGTIGRLIPGGGLQQGSAPIQQGAQSPLSAALSSPGLRNSTNYIGPHSGMTPGGMANTQPIASVTQGQSGSSPSNSQGISNFPSTAISSPAGGYGSLLSPFTADTFKQYSPAYQFQLQQGQQGVLNADSSGQGALSGAAQKDLINYNQGLANTSFNNAFNQYQTQQGNIYSRLSGIANQGQNAASNTGAQGTALAGQAAQSATNVGSALAAGQVGAANAWSGAASSLGGLYAAYGGGGSQAPALTSSQYSGGYGATGGTDFISSDRRLKKNIRRIGSTEGGQPWYEFEYIDKPGLHTGVMADESPPSAVTYDADGYAMVDYSRIR